MVGRPRPEWFPSKYAFLRRGWHMLMIPFGSEEITTLLRAMYPSDRDIQWNIAFPSGNGKVNSAAEWMHPIWNSPKRIPYFPRSNGIFWAYVNDLPRKIINRPAKPGCFDLGDYPSRRRDASPKSIPVRYLDVTFRSEGRYDPSGKQTGAL